MHISTLDRYSGAVDQTAKEAAVSTPSGETRSRGSAQPAAGGGQPHLLLRQAEAIDAIFQEASSKLDRMKDVLQGILKTYPPYPPGSEERVAKLQKYDALRRQIEELGPPATREPDGDEEKSSAAALPARQKMWDFVFDDRGRVRAVAADDGAAGGKSGDAWQVPALPENAPDEAIHDAAGRLERLSDAVQQKRSEFWSSLDPYALADLYA